MEGLGIKHRFLIEDKASQVYEHLQTSKTGLSEAEAEKRYRNLKVREAKQNQFYFWLKIFVRQYKSALIVLLLLGGLFSFLIGEDSQGWVIFLVVLINALVGSFQEFRAENALAEFKKLIPHYSRVRRGDKVITLKSKFVVPGDILLISAGDMVPVDARLIEASSLKLNESALTGEFESKIKYAGELKKHNLPVAEIDNCIFAGTNVVEGDGEAVVIATGHDTVIGQVENLVLTAKPPKTPLEKQIDKISRFSAAAGLTVGATILFLSIIFHLPLVQAILLIISTMVAIVPEGLTSAVSVTLALGSLRLVKKQAIVRRLPIVQTLGSVMVICTDKTGTLTNNQLKLADKLILNESKFSADWFLAIAACCNAAVISTKGIIGDQVDVALYEAVGKKNFSLERRRFKEIADLPFDSVRKRMSVIVEDVKGQRWCLTKGAVNGLIDQFSKEHQHKISQTMDDWAEEGKKVLIFAMRQITAKEWEKYRQNPENFDKEIEDNLNPLALVSFIDEPKAGIDRAIALSSTANVRTIMITGDWAKTAVSVGKQIGLYTDTPKIITGPELVHLRTQELSRILKSSVPVLFSEIDPRQKQKIVQALQSNGEIVGMTGDGVNDAPALRQADIGIAMGKYGTDIARESAGMVLKNDSYATIVDSIKEGRTIFSNIRKFVFYEFITVAVQVFVVILGLIFGLPPVLAPVQIIVLDFLVGLMPSLALGVDAAEPDVMSHHPSVYNQVLLSPKTIRRIIRTGVLASLTAILAYFIVIWQSGSSAAATTSVFLSIALFMIAFAMHSRSENQTLDQLFRTKNTWLIWSMIVSLFVTILVIYLPFLNHILETTPLSLTEWFVPILGMILIMLVEDIFKRFQQKRSINLKSHS